MHPLQYEETQVEEYIGGDGPPVYREEPDSWRFTTTMATVTVCLSF